MTIAVAWIRRILDCEELVFVSDSRLSGDSSNFDGCPKVITLPRSDCAICFAGYTGHAFPMMLQLSLAIDSYAPARRGSLDMKIMLSHALKVFDTMANQLVCSPHVKPPQSSNPDVTFLFGGYSWIKKTFELWTINYLPSQNKFVALPAPWLDDSSDAGKVIIRKSKPKEESRNLGRIAFAGDQAALAKCMLLEKLSSKSKRPDSELPLDWEPFEVVRDMLRNDERSETIGGAPQIVKVYQYMQSAPLAIYWPDKSSGQVYLQGRPCLSYERIDPWILDPDTLRSENPNYSESGGQDLEKVLALDQLAE